MKRKSLILVIIFVLVILIIFLFNNKKNKEDVKVEYTSEDIAVVKDSVIKKVNIMNADNMLIDIYNDGFNLENIDYNLIAKGILINSKEDGQISDEEANEYDECVNTSYINLSSVEDKFKLLFNSVPSVNYDVDSINYIYDEKNKRFFESCINILDGSKFIDTYIYDFKLDKDIAEVYISVSYGTEEPIISDGNTKIIIYKDYSRENIYKEFIYDIDNPTDDFILDEGNYTDFSQYKYTFKKVNDDYYFYSLEKIK